MEIELRAKINSRDVFAKKLAEVGGNSVAMVSTSFQHDEYFKHVTDINRTMVMRIRKVDGDKSILTFKAHDTSGGDNAWEDVDAVIDNPEVLRNILLTHQYETVVEIKKKRDTFNYQGYELNIDEIDGLGVFVEIEGRGNDNERAEIEQRLKKILASFDIQESDFIHKGYVPLMLEAKPCITV